MYHTMKLRDTCFLCLGIVVSLTFLCNKQLIFKINGNDRYKTLQKINTVELLVIYKTFSNLDVKS